MERREEGRERKGGEEKRRGGEEEVQAEQEQSIVLYLMHRTTTLKAAFNSAGREIASGVLIRRGKKQVTLRANTCAWP